MTQINVDTLMTKDMYDLLKTEGLISNEKLEKSNYQLAGIEYKLCLNDFEDMLGIIELHEMEKNTKVNSIFKISVIKFKLNYDLSLKREFNGQNPVEINPTGEDGISYFELKGFCQDTDIALYTDLMYAFS